MARFFPSRLGTKTTFGERLVFKRLHELDDSWIVLSQLQFLSERTKTSGLREGEADFVLLHPRRGLVLLEVKDSRYRIDGREWYRLPKDGGQERDRNPFEQARLNRHRIDDMLKDAGVSWVPSGYAVFFTAGRPSGRLGLDAPPEIVITQDSFDDVPRRINSIATHWGSGSWKRNADFERATSALSPSVVLKPTLDYAIDVSVGELDRLTDAQVALTARQLEAVRATASGPRSLILGAAGTGKTFIGYTYARQRAKEGQRVAVIGTPPQLRLVTRRKLSTQGIHSGEAFDVISGIYSPQTAEQYLDVPVWEAALDLAEKHGPALDCLIVDEAQSLDSDLIDALVELVVPDGQVVLLADPYQKDSSGTWRPSGNYESFWLTENCRNALPIAKVVSRVASMPAPAVGAAGVSPVLSYATGAFWDSAVAAVSASLETVPQGDVVVLTRTTRGARRAYEALQRAGHKASLRFTGERVAVLTVDAFRGCEARYVAYMAEECDDDDTRTLDYLAVSRACAHLIVVGDPQAWDDSSFLFDVRS